MAVAAELAGATVAAITLVQHGQVPSPAHSSELAGRVGYIQSEQAVAQSPVKLLTRAHQAAWILGDRSNLNGPVNSKIAAPSAQQKRAVWASAARGMGRSRGLPPLV